MAVCRRDGILGRRLPIAEVVGICDLSETLARAVSERFGVRAAFTQFDEMLTRFYAVSNLTQEGVPNDAWRQELTQVLG